MTMPMALIFSLCFYAVSSLPFLAGDAELKCQLSGADKYVFALVSQIRLCKLIMTSVFVCDIMA